MAKVNKIKSATVYAEDAIEESRGKCDVIDASSINSIPELFAERVKRSAGEKAYSQFDPDTNTWIDYSWGDMSEGMEHWRRAIAADGLETGERVAISMVNSREWVLFDQAALAQGLVVVPVYVEDRAENIAYILEHTESRLYMVQNYSQWLELKGELTSLSAIKRVIVVSGENPELENNGETRVVSLNSWLASATSDLPQPPKIASGDLATIVYTSGTTGKPKGVMLSHSNMYLDAYAGLQSVAVYPTDQFLSFLPLSHMFERTVGYYLTMMAGAAVAFNRAIPQLLDDMAEIKPTAMITVPRIFERAFAKIKAQLDDGPEFKRWLFEQAVSVGWQRFEYSQGRASWQWKQCFWPVLNLLVARKVALRFGGRLRFVVSGGARLAPNVAMVFIGLGIPILQGYGLTESSPVLTVNTLKRNKPSSIGLPFRGAELRLGENGELQARGPFVMLGYWKNSEATGQAINPNGWLMTGDIANIDEEGFISITGRIKEIIVMANGEKAPPADLESAITSDPLFEQALVIGEGKAYLTAVVVLNSETWVKVAQTLGVDPNDKAQLNADRIQEIVLDRISKQLKEFPGYAFIRYVTLSTKVWTVEDGSVTPTLKLKRPVLMERFKEQIDSMYLK